MYTDSIKSEKRLLGAIERSIYSSKDTGKQDGQEVVACPCPKCHRGNIVTHYKSHGQGYLSHQHICEACGEEYVLYDIYQDILKHRTYEQIEEVSTPFGKIHVRLNGKVIPFTYWREKYRSYSADKYEKSLVIHKIRIDLRSLKTGDVVNCGFDNHKLEFEGSDERSVCFYCENDRYMLGYGAPDIEPEEEDGYCFEIACDGRDGMSYEIIRDPKEYVSENYPGASSIWINVAWAEKKNHKDWDFLFFLY